jgi:hypothetical protein
MNKILRRSALAAAISFLAVSTPVAHAAEDEGWDWMVAPYGWAASIGTDLRSGQPPVGGTSTDIDFDDIIDKIDGAFQIHVEGQGDHFGVFADFTYLGLADERDHPRFRTESDLDTRLFEIAAVWSPGDQRHRGVELFAGLRYIDVDVTVQLDPENPLFETTSLDGGETFNDFMVGVRYTWDLSDRWGVTMRGDGSFGDTDGTWNASVVADYKMKHGAWLFGYRYLSVELKTRGNRFDITMNGPMVGYGFMF